LKPIQWKDDPRLAYVLVNLATLFWASNIALGRFLRGQIGPLTLTAFRFSLAGLFFALLVRRRPEEYQPIQRDGFGLLGMGILGVFSFPTLLYLALQRTTATNAALINGAGPLVTALLAAWLLKERFNHKLAVGIILSLFGVIFVIGGQILRYLDTSNINFGDLIVFVDVFIWGFYSIIGRRVMRSRSALRTTAYSIWFALPILLVAASLEWQTFPAQLNLRVIAAGIYIAIFPTTISFLSWNEGIRRIGPARAMVFYNMLPVYGAILGILFLNETPLWSQLVGGALVISGGLTASRA
jgi:drug/metabolite transporter (DMT)-like permease